MTCPKITQLVGSQTEIHTPVPSQMQMSQLQASLLLPHLFKSWCWSQPEVQSFLPSPKMHPSMHLANAYPSTINRGEILIQACMGHYNSFPNKAQLENQHFRVFRFGPQNPTSNQVAHVAWVLEGSGRFRPETMFYNYTVSGLFLVTFFSPLHEFLSFEAAKPPIEFQREIR